jgi:uncharacterized Fe-S cluster-containing radical SAM superfamily protein
MGRPHWVDWSMSVPIDTARFSSTMRERGIRIPDRKVAISRLSGSLQEQDLSEPTNCSGLGRIRHFRRSTSSGWPENPLPIDPAALALGLGRVDQLRAQVFQNAVCNWRCWYCYVDFDLLSANPTRTDYRDAGELLDLYLEEADRPAVIDLSGGQPDLVPEWVVWMLTEIELRDLGKEVYLWSDDNLSNDYYFSKLSDQDRHVIESARGYGKVCCLKGFDQASFAFNTGAEPESFDLQLKILDRLLKETPIDIYCYSTFTTPSATRIDGLMSIFVDRLQEIDPLLPLRVVPLEITEFSPVFPRISDAHVRALDVQQEAIRSWRAEIDSRFSAVEKTMEICDVHLASR